MKSRSQRANYSNTVVDCRSLPVSALACLINKFMSGICQIWCNLWAPDLMASCIPRAVSPLLLKKNNPRKHPNEPFQTVSMGVCGTISRQIKLTTASLITIAERKGFVNGKLFPSPCQNQAGVRLILSLSYPKGVAVPAGSLHYSPAPIPSARFDHVTSPVAFWPWVMCRDATRTIYFTPNYYTS